MKYKNEDGIQAKILSETEYYKLQLDINELGNKYDIIDLQFSTCSSELITDFSVLALVKEKQNQEYNPYM